MNLKKLIAAFEIAIKALFVAESSQSGNSQPSCPASPIPYGGQAVIEGVMMKGKRFAAVALRTGAGEIEVYDKPLKSKFSRRLTEMPFVRGFFMLWDMMGLGMWALNLSSERYAITHLHEAPVQKKNKIGEYLLIGLSLAFALFIFKAAPTWIVEGLAHFNLLGALSSAEGGVGELMLKNIIEGAIRLSIFVVYILAISRLAEIRRVFEYHGAEHTVINAHEADQDNHSLDYIQTFDTLHPRCGTSFIVIMVVLMIIIVSIIDAAIVAAFFPGLSWPPLWVRLLTRIAVIPILSGVSYEIIKHAYKFRHIKPVDWFLRFGMAFQRLTTRRPDRGQLECGLASLLRVREYDEEMNISNIAFETKVKWMGEKRETSEDSEADEASLPKVAAAAAQPAGAKSDVE